MAPPRGKRAEDARTESRHDGNRADSTGHPHRRVALVSREGLVAAVPRQRDRDVLPRDLRDEKRGQDGLVSERLVEERRQLGDELDRIGLDEKLLVHRAEGARGNAGCGALVVAWIMDADRERPNGPGRLLRHQADDDRRVDPSGEQGSERDVAHEPAPHRVAHGRSYALEPLVSGHVARLGLEGPVPLRPDLAVLPDEDASRLESADPGHARLDARDVLERQVRIERPG